MNRRTSLKLIGGMVGVGLSAELETFAANERRAKLRFGVLTDPHYADKDTSGLRYYRQSLDKLRAAIDTFNDSKLDFIIELGDFKDMTADKSQTLKFLDSMEAEFQRFRGARYHVLGNHDVDCLSKSEFLQHTVNSGKANGKNYYAFNAGKIKCIALDANFKLDGTPYNSGNYEWTEALIPNEEKAWLAKELKENRPTIVFIHQLLDKFSDVNPRVCVANANEITDLLERNGNVIAVFQGHHHEGHYSRRKNIHYHTLKAMVTGSLPENNSFAIVEIDNQLNVTVTANLLDKKA